MRERQVERAAIRRDGYGHILEEPEAHRKRREEEMKRQQEAEKQQRKGRYLSMRI